MPAGYRARRTGLNHMALSLLVLAGCSALALSGLPVMNLLLWIGWHMDRLGLG